MDVKVCLVVILLSVIATDNVFAAVSGTTCAANGNECVGITNAVCDTAPTQPVCKCKAGYTEDSNSKCQPDLNSPCIDDDTCSTDNAACVGDTGSKLCKCSSGFKDDGSGGCIPDKAVSGTTCTADGTECDVITNAVCDTAPTQPVCKCKDGYTEDSNSKCQPDVTGAVCGTPTGSEVACSTIDNAECVGIAPGKCVCKTGTTHDSGSCTLGLEGDCTGGLTCTTMNAACSINKCSCESGYVANNGACDKVLTDIGCTADGNECPSPAVCGSNNKCQCSDGYVLESNNCVKVFTEIDCSANGDNDCTAENSVCGNNDKCQCGVGFVLQGNKCETDSGAASTKAIIWMVFSSLLILLFNKLMM